MAARAYTMRIRAEAVEATRQRVLDATRDLFMERPDPDSITLGAVAARAGTSEMTVIRHFGTKAALIEAAEARERERIVSSRRATPGHVDEAIHFLFLHYEETGDWGMRMQALEVSTPGLRGLMKRARAAHRAWVEETFAPQLSRQPASARELTVTALVVACDLLTWKQLRRDLHLPIPQAEAVVRRMVTALTSAGA